MADDKLAELLAKQKSLTEWLEEIKHSDASLIRKEDNDKRERLKILNEQIGLPFDKPTQFEATELSDDNDNFLEFLESRGDELCALRLMPKVEGLPKLRMRGKSIRDAYKWFKEQDLNPESYRADFVPHASDSSWATIFIVNEHGIQGEIIDGGHHQLTQGVHDNIAPSVFKYDYDKWEINDDNKRAIEYLKVLTEYIHVPDKDKQNILNKLLGATFTNDYLVGYFESTHSSMGTWYIDYNQSIGDKYKDVEFRIDQPINDAPINGQTGCSGSAIGTVCIVDPDALDADFPDKGILVCEVTTPDYIPLMQKAGAIVTDQGGILSHAAIVARELGKPCIVATGDATKVLQNGDQVIVDADLGTVRYSDVK